MFVSKAYRASVSSAEQTHPNQQTKKNTVTYTPSHPTMYCRRSVYSPIPSHQFSSASSSLSAVYSRPSTKTIATQFACRPESVNPGVVARESALSGIRDHKFGSYTLVRRFVDNRFLSFNRRAVRINSERALNVGKNSAKNNRAPWW